MAEDIEKTKADLVDVMGRKLVILRSMLSSMRQEKHLFSGEHPLEREKVIDDRLNLVIAFEKWNHHFLTSILELSNKWGDPIQEEVLESFALTLEWLQSHLKALDVELVLICEQLHGILGEIRGEAASLATLAETGCAKSTRFFSYAGPVTPRVSPIALAVLDKEE